MGRTHPPEDVRRQLRREVNFRCPICGSPFLTYHHFDPPYRARPHHNPDGMIALCTECHAFADQGKYTDKQLRELKCKPNSSLRKFGWQRNELVVFAGGLYVNPRVYLRLKGRDIIWFNRDAYGNLLLNVDIRDESDNSVILIEENDLKEYLCIEEICDIEIKPHGQELTIKASKVGVLFSIRFMNCEQETLKELGRKWNMKLEQRPGPQVPIGPFGQVSPDGLERILARYGPGLERDFILSQIELNKMIANGPTRWDLLRLSIRRWPVTVCTVRLELKHPLSVDISPGQESVGGWGAGHTIGVGSGVIWDIQ